MAKKKDFSNIANDNKNLSGVAGIFSNPSTNSSETTKREKETEIDADEHEMEFYHLKIESYILKFLRIRKANVKLSLKDQIKEALVSYYNIEEPEE